MDRCDTRSDQLNMWSDKNARTLDLNPAAAQDNLTWPDAAYGCSAAWLADRALQTLRQAELQMRQGPWSWPQVLSFRQPQRCPPRDGLCAQSTPSRGGRSLDLLSPHSGDSRRAMRDQSRVVTPARGVLSRDGERGRDHVCRPCDRCCKLVDGQYGRRLAPDCRRCRWPRRPGDGG